MPIGKNRVNDEVEDYGRIGRYGKGKIIGSRLVSMNVVILRHQQNCLMYPSHDRDLQVKPNLQILTFYKPLNPKSVTTLETT